MIFGQHLLVFVNKTLYLIFKTTIIEFRCLRIILPTLPTDSVCRSRGSTFAYTEDNHTSVLGMRELAPMANLLCLTRNEAHEALDKMPPSSTKKNLSVCSSNSLFAFPAQSNFAGTKYPLEWIETCQEGALDQYTGNGVKSR